MNTYPSFDEEHERLRELKPHLFEAFEAARQLASEFFTKRDRPFDPYLYPHLIRYHVMEFLASRRPLFPELDLKTLQMNGVEFEWGFRRYRIWKSDEGEIPEPGDSQAVARYLNQQTLFDLGPLTKWRLVILWDFENGRPLLRLALPEQSNGKWATPKAYWVEEIPFDLSEIAGDGSGDKPVGDGELDMRPIHADELRRAGDE